MVKQVTKNNSPYALISGGSKGIGFAIAVALAARNFNLVLIARSEEDLIKAKNRIESQYTVHVDILVMDLGQPDSAEKISRWCSENDLPLKILCNVTGIGGAADFLSAPLSDNLYMLRLNTEPAVSLIYHLLAILKKNQPSYILNVSSMAGFAPISIKNIYSATKSAMIFFSYSLRYQLKKENISVSCLCPGPVFTKPEIEKETINKLGWLGRQMAVPVERLGRIAVDQTFAKTMIIVPGIMPKIVSVILRALPRRLISFIYYKLSTRKSFV